MPCTSTPVLWPNTFRCAADRSVRHRPHAAPCCPDAVLAAIDRAARRAGLRDTRKSPYFPSLQRRGLHDPDATLPFDGAISRFLAEGAPKAVRKASRRRARTISSRSHTYREEMKRKDYDTHMEALQIELARCRTTSRPRQASDRGVRGADAPAKVGHHDSVRENLNPGSAPSFALSKPSDARPRNGTPALCGLVPAKGEMALFDRSWYNRAMIEHVFGFCTPYQREQFFRQLPDFERKLVDEGILFRKIWLEVGRAEQLKRFLDREADR